ncbi:hypothetical protein Tco_0038701 [Tanacetum coccineum]
MVRPPFWQIRAHSEPINNLDLVYDYADQIDCDLFSIHELVGMLGECGLGNGDKMIFTHFRIPGKSLDDGLVLLMADEHVPTLLKYLPGCKEIEVYIEANVSLVGQHMLEVRSGQPIEVVIEEIVEENIVSEPVKQKKVNEPAKQGMVGQLGQSSIVETVEILVCDTDVPPALVENVKQTVAMEQPRAFSFQNLLEHIASDGVNEQLGGFVHRIVEDTMIRNKDAEHAKLHFEVDVNLDQVRMVANKNWDDCGVDVIDFDDLDSGGEGDEEQPTKNSFYWRKIIFTMVTSIGIHHSKPNALCSVPFDETSAEPAFVEANYEVLESLLRGRRRQVRNEDIRTKLDYYSEKYDEEREMEPRLVRVKEATPVIRTGSPHVQRHKGRVVEL